MKSDQESQGKSRSDKAEQFSAEPCSESNRGANGQAEQQSDQSLTPAEEKPVSAREEQSPDTRDKSSSLAIWIALTSLAISLGSFLLALYSYRSQQIEKVIVDASFLRGPSNVRCQSFGGIGGVLQTPVSVLLSNVGNRTISVVSYEVRSLEEGSVSAYTYIDGGLGERGTIPLTLQSGASELIEIYVGLMPTPEAREVIQQSGLCDRPFTRRDLRLELGRHGIDLYGNKVTFSEYDSGGFTLSGPSESEFRGQQILLLFESGRGTLATDVVGWYP